ncbi:MAG: hypothetical protein ABSC50_03510 [Candidatus Bathyarchaeia archaeon]
MSTEISSVIASFSISQGKKRKLTPETEKIGMENLRKCQSEKWTGKKRDYVRKARLSGQVHNNKMDRMNGELRDRERVMRTLEKADTPINRLPDLP